MKRKRFMEEQIIGMLKEAEAGVKTGDLARRHGIPDPGRLRGNDLCNGVGHA